VRAAVILGLGSSEKDLKPFQMGSAVTWMLGLPASSNDADVVLIFGGDGTVHRHLPQLIRLELPVLVVPRGSGNDFARALRIRSVRGSLQAWKKFAAGGENMRRIDVGVITSLAKESGPSSGFDHHPTSESLPAPHYFCCVGGVGLDGEIARRANQLPRWLRGHGGYALALPAAVSAFAPVEMQIDVAAEDGRPLVTHSEKPVLLAAFANTPVYGGGMKIAPRAKLGDGRLDICVVGKVGRIRLLRLFPTIYFGRHLKAPEVEYFQASRVRLAPRTPHLPHSD
jgi:diacylglycerol kinase family enzyme